MQVEKIIVKFNPFSKFKITLLFEIDSSTQ